MQLTVNNHLEGCPDGCIHHKVHCEYNEIRLWDSAIASLEIDVWCEHEKVCKLRKEAERNEEHNAS